MSKQKTLVLLTQKFPFESGEEFLFVELNRLSQAFDQVTILPTAVRDFSSPRPTGKNTKVRTVKNPETAREIAGAFLSNFPQVIILFLSEMRKSGWNWKLWKYYIYHIPYALQLKSKMAVELNVAGDLVLYSYWMDTNAFAAALLTKENPQIKLVVRSHGGDLYNERQQYGGVAFRKSVYEASASLLFISEHGRHYAATQYPEFSSKMKVFRLGVEDLEMGPILSFPRRFLVVSCSGVIPLKRLSLIAAVLGESSLPICWVHFGGENSAINALKSSLPETRRELQIEWKGKVKNAEVQSFYASQHVDLLINLSSSEGIPVSMMEAISFGIPLFANAVGGIPEILNPETGILIPEGLEVKEIAARLDLFLRSGKTRNSGFREGVRSFWNQNYSAEHNHGQVLDHLLNHTFTIRKREE